MSKCKKCNAELKWVTMASGAKMPLDAKPINMVQVKEDIGAVIQVYQPHWSTCPNAKEFKKK